MPSMTARFNRMVRQMEAARDAAILCAVMLEGETEGQAIARYRAQGVTCTIVPLTEADANL